MGYPEKSSFLGLFPAGARPKKNPLNGGRFGLGLGRIHSFFFFGSGRGGGGDVGGRGGWSS